LAHLGYLGALIRHQEQSQDTLKTQLEHLSVEDG
jgi:hypothetical protein